MWSNLSICYIKYVLFHVKCTDFPFYVHGGVLWPLLIKSKIRCNITEKLLGHFQRQYLSIDMNLIKFDIKKCFLISYILQTSKLYHFTFEHMTFVPRACFYGYHEILYPRYLCRGVYSFRLSVRPFVCSFVRSFVRPYFRPVRGITSKLYVQATRVEHISPTTNQKAFIFGP